MQNWRWNWNRSQICCSTGALINIVGHIELKRAQVHKFFVVAPQRKLRFSKAQLHSLRLKLLDTTFNCNFYEWWYGKSLLALIIQCSGLVQRLIIWWPGLKSCKLQKSCEKCLSYLKRLRLRFYLITFFCANLCSWHNCCGAMRCK